MDLLKVIEAWLVFINIFTFSVSAISVISPVISGRMPPFFVRIYHSIAFKIVTKPFHFVIKWYFCRFMDILSCSLTIYNL